MAGFDGEAKGPLGTETPGADDIVSEARERYQLCMDAEDRTDALDDLRFLKGEQWDADAIRQRELDNRPCLTFNNIPAILHQVENDARQNKQSVHVAPVDDGADVEVADVIGGLIRHIEYDSDADAAYDTALANAARVGFGYFRLVTEYSSPTSFDQDIKIKRIRNPFTVFLDPDAQEADASDMRFAFISSKVPRTEFDRLYPDRSADGDGIGTAPGDNATWVGKDYVRLAEYYRVEHEPDTLVMLGDGSTMLKSDKQFKQGMAIKTERPTTRRKVMWYKLNGWEVLEKAEIACPWIPIFPVYGDEIDIDGEVTRNGIIRNAKAPKQMENYFLTAATEEIALRTKTPFIGALGQFEGLEQDWEQANVRNFAFLEYNPVALNGSLAPAPQRQPPADVPQGYVQMAVISGDKVKAVTGIYDASLGNRSNEVSGLAIKARQNQGDIANFHFADNLTRAITRMAKCLIKMIPRIYDAPRVVRILGEDRKTAEHVAINTPGQKMDDQGQAIQTILNDLTVGEYDVTVTTGPAYSTMRQETVANMIELGGKWPKLLDVAGDKLVQAMDWPGAQEIAERLEKTLPPGLQDQDEEQANMVQTPKGPIPKDQAGQLIGQLDQTLEKMQAEMEDLKSGVAKAQVDAQAKLQIAQLDNASKERIAALQVAGKHDDTELAGIIELLVAKQGSSLGAVEAVRDHMLALEQANGMAAIDHGAAVAAATDPNHPAAPAPIAQGMEVAPATQAMAEQDTASGAGSQAPADNGAA